MIRTRSPFHGVLALLPVFALAVATAQVAQFAGDPTETYELQVVSGEITVDALMTDRLALVFFVPTACEACEVLLNEGLHEFKALPIVLVTSGAATGLEGWLDRNTEWNVWLDTNDQLARDLHVTEAPTVFMIDSGAVVNADYWPFFGGLEGLVAQLEYFATAPPSPRAAPIIDDLQGRELEELIAVGASGQSVHLSGLAPPRLFMICWPGCSACSTASDYYVHLYATEKGLPPLTILLVSDGEEAGGTDFEAWDSTGLEVLRIDRANAAFLDLPLSPVHFMVDADGVIDWAMVGFTPSIGTRLVEWVESSR